MTPTTQIASAVESAEDTKIVGLISAAHFVSHYYFNVLPPLFFLVKPDFGLSYQQIGIALTAFYIVSAVTQTPAGFIVDRISSRWSLVAALVLGGGAYMVAGWTSNFYLFVVMFAIVGLANTVYHPANYTVLSKRVSAPRMSHAYSVHAFAGYLGTAVTPACQVALAGMLGWRGAFVAAGLLGVFAGVVLVAFGDVLTIPKEQGKSTTPTKTVGRDILFSSAILLNVLFFVVIALSSGAVQSFGLVALQDLWGYSVSFSTTAVSVYLGFATAGVLAGGFVAARTTRPDLIAMAGMGVGALLMAPVGLFDLGPVLTVTLMAASGLCTGLITASRDLLVRSVTPHGAYGAVFGFVTTGFALGGMLTPMIFGWLMDHAMPSGIFIGAAIIGLLALPILLINGTGPRLAK